MKNFFKNWKTTLSGIGAISLGISLCIKQQWGEGVTSIVAGLGLLFAKDGDVTGGNRVQPTSPEATEKIKRNLIS